MWSVRAIAHDCHFSQCFHSCHIAATHSCCHSCHAFLLLPPLLHVLKPICLQHCFHLWRWYVLSGSEVLIFLRVMTCPQTYMSTRVIIKTGGCTRASKDSTILTYMWLTKCFFSKASCNSSQGELCFLDSRSSSLTINCCKINNETDNSSLVGGLKCYGHGKLLLI